MPGMESSSSVKFLSTPSDKTEYIHNFINTLRFSNYYDDGIENKTLEWLLDLENAGELVKYLCTYIGPENILQEEEINEYLELTAEGNLDTIALNHSQFNEVPSSSDEVTYESIALLEEEILELDNFMTVVSNQDGILRSKSKLLEDDLLQECEKSKSVQRQVQKAAHACIKASKNLDLARTQFMECFKSPNSIINNSQSDQRKHQELLAHMPIKDLLAKYDRSIQYIDLITSQNRVKPEISSGSSKSTAQFISSKTKTLLSKTLHRFTLWADILIRAKTKLVLAHLEGHELLTGLNHITKLTNDIETGVFQPTQNKLRIQLVHLESSIEELRRNSLGIDLANYIERFMRASVMQIFDKLREKAKWHQDNRFESWQKLLKCVEARVHYCHLLMVLLVGEKQKLNDVTLLLLEYTESLAEEFQQLMERIAQMETIHRGPRDGKELCESSFLRKTLMSLLAPTQTLHTEELLVAFKSLDDSILSDERLLLHTSYLTMDETLTKSLQSLQEMVKLMFSGPTKKPMIVDLDLSRQLYDIDRMVKGLKERLYAIIAICEVTKTTKMSNKYFRFRRLLWVHFLTECRIDDVIAGMKLALRTQEKLKSKTCD